MQITKAQYTANGRYSKHSFIGVTRNGFEVVTSKVYDLEAHDAEYVLAVFGDEGTEGIHFNLNKPGYEVYAMAFDGIQHVCGRFGGFTMGDRMDACEFAKMTL